MSLILGQNGVVEQGCLGSVEHVLTPREGIPESTYLRCLHRYAAAFHHRLTPVDSKARSSFLLSTAGYTH